MATDRDTSSQTKDAATRRTDQVEAAADETAASTRAVVGEAAEAGRKTARTGLDTATAVSREFGATAGRTTEDATQRIGQFFSMQARASEDMANRTSQTFDVIMQCGTVMADGWQSIMKEWMDYAQGAVQRNMDGVNDIMRARSVQDVLTKQNDRVREELELLLNSSARVSEASARVAGDACRRLHERSEQQQRRTA